MRRSQQHKKVETVFPTTFSGQYNTLQAVAVEVGTPVTQSIVPLGD
jgi:hypothetical protein